MAGPLVAGTFVTGRSLSPGATSDVCVINTGRTTMRLTLVGLDASNTVKTQKRTTPGAVFVDQTTYSSDQIAASVGVAVGEEWRLMKVVQQAVRDIRYVLDAL